MIVILSVIIKKLTNLKNDGLRRYPSFKTDGLCVMPLCRAWTRVVFIAYFFFVAFRTPVGW